MSGAETLTLLVTGRGLCVLIACDRYKKIRHVGSSERLAGYQALTVDCVDGRRMRHQSSNTDSVFVVCRVSKLSTVS